MGRKYEICLPLTRAAPRARARVSERVPHAGGWPGPGRC